MHNLLEHIRKLSAYDDLKNNLNNSKGEQAAFGLMGTQKTALISSLLNDLQCASIIIASEEKQALSWQEDLQTLLPDYNVLFYPKKDIKLQRLLLADSHDATKLRLQVMQALKTNHQVVVLTTIEAIMEALPKPESLWQLAIKVQSGGIIDQNDLIKELISSGYKRTNQVEAYAQFSVRGDIIDIFTLLHEYPIRIEFFGDEVDSIRYFDVNDQRTVKVVDNVTLMPASEYSFNMNKMNSGLKLLESDINRNIKAIPDSQMKNRWLEDLAILKQGNGVAGYEQYSAYFTSLNYSLLSYCEQQPLIIWDEPARLADRARLLLTEIFNDNNLLPRQQATLHSYSSLVDDSTKTKKSLTLSLLSRQVKPHKPTALHTFAARQVPVFHGQIDLLIEEIKHRVKQNYRVLITCNDSSKLKALADQIKGCGIESLVVDKFPDNLAGGQVLLTQGSLKKGFEIPELQLIMITEHDIFGTVKRARRKTTGQKDSRKKLLDYRELNVGDYVVHVSHGIGVYQGLKTMEINNVHRDYLTIKYKGEDRLYVPVDQIQLVQKYVGSEGNAPRLYALGNSEWQKVKKRVKASVQEMASELLKLYAKREAVGGISYPTDDKWQDEFENAFPFNETEDQLKAIHDIKQDMINHTPMDRLLCGDVGYGKTEVALRAVFKAAMFGKQVAILVPTTILAHQHYRTFKSRLTKYPLNVAMLSRFRSRKENLKTIERLNQGLVDVVVGTHAILQDKVKFKDLGLLVIDEEQRFGVAHKEKIKQLKSNVDVLTLSATPIPRTLHMSMVGMRDLSLIETPPENRYPVQTYVVEYEANLIAECIKRELEREGQVYFLHNRVKDIEYTAEKLQKILPEARIAVGHGQMSERKLEQIMLDFFNHEYDVLVSTTIIESGLDIPNVNTLIVEDADKFGLSQLYQLRGRVGRANRMAYAYLTYRKDKVLSEIAEKRLNAIREFTELGAGFKIALRDLQIRGAGNVLGPEQSGFMMQVGYDMYVNLLEQSIRELKGELPEQKFECEIEVAIDAYIPNRYIKDNKLKIEMYKKIVSCRHVNDIHDITDELLDRFGNPPLPVRNLLLITEIKSLLEILKIQSLKRTKNTFKAVFANNAAIKPDSFQNLWKTYGSQIQLTTGSTVILKLCVKSEEPEQQLKELSRILYKLIEFEKEE
ncbi:transcription-repair coupling factor [Clostridium sp. 'deep sea']|uniref:transcription-repair coupling factor n=1 Tax=Clostridium sp. 'deep sea' TaxID=2779445 RepID=UPI0018964B01|nr:transcription-repair coupling factor [Clostridium sp. 'deep sea']QOR34512.1 transcription-repair coupling factor [Clostridium sp. 'deep sea']